MAVVWCVKKFKPRLSKWNGIMVKSNNIGYLLILTVTLSLIFTIWGAWQPGQMYTDEPVYVDLAIRVLAVGERSPVVFSPLYIDLITPFVAIFFEKETGFIVWKFMLFLGTSFLIFLCIKRISNQWIGLLLAIDFQLLEIPYKSGTLSTLMITWLLICCLLLLSKRNVLGLVVGILILGIHIRGEFLIITLAFLVFALIFSREKLFSKQFVIQLIVPVILFIGLIYWHGSNISEYKKMYSLRGGFAYQHYIINTMLELGYFKKYTDETNRGLLTREDINKVYKEHLGKTLDQYREEAKFNLPELYRRNPELIKVHYRRIFNSSLHTIPGAFIINFPVNSRFYLRKLPISVKQFYVLVALIHLLFVMLAIIPSILSTKLLKITSDAYQKIPKEAIYIIIAPLASFIPWFLAKPAEHYVIMSASSLYLGVACILAFMLHMINKIKEKRISSN